MPTKLLNDVKLRKSKCPQGKTILKLSDVGGLYLWVFANGKKHWRFRWHVDGKEQSLALGEYPHVSLTQARSRRDALQEKRAAGVDPSESRKAEQQAKIATAANGAQYTYDALDQRAEKTGGGNPGEVIYFAGRPLALLNPSTGAWTDLIWAGNNMIAVVAGTQTAVPTYRLVDHLGTLAMVTDNSGNVLGTNTMAPYGQTLANNTSDAYPFTGLFQDTEYNGDQALYRSYAAAPGRWLSPDPYNGSYDLSNPQSFNRYMYVGGNPLAFTDPSGQFLCPPVICGSPSTVVHVFATVPVIDPITAVVSAVLDFIELGNFLGWWGGMPQFNGNVQASQNGKNVPNNGRNCSAGPASAGQYVAATAEVATLTSQYASGLGPGNQILGPGTATSAVMGQSAGVQDVLNSYYMTGQTSGLYTFGAAGAVSAGGNPVAQFVGSFRWSISGGNLSLTNTTSFRSLTYDMGPQWQRSSFAPGGNTHQTYQIQLHCGG